MHFLSEPNEKKERLNARSLLGPPPLVLNARSERSHLTNRTNKENAHSSRRTPLTPVSQGTRGDPGVNPWCLRLTARAAKVARARWWWWNLLVVSQAEDFNACLHNHLGSSCIPTPSNRSALEAFADLKVAGGDLLEGAGS